ncbi:hypothetical protein A3A38_00115 [Candidatus Kaiserbacteria bacterium RIFCSPLOWO2_01_FULL_53_17]|uniref:Glycosyltransferase RgtA/B/C/D-like domain-containing protein n=1 Tax=Candidatus Kaiserbacteria bacterium RIFCSPLOWO2_01_FULL_53_17 TaxID=1798511 RepID=A0A1F6EH53_9BACT|nr:MAG: hypothetical protein A3A38_00115 [Candidatus Kaiserbacteria bacterium RIFCSPLOWO2_01_FULL_53_17]
MKSRAKDLWALVAVMTAALVNFVVFGLVHETGWKDAADYSAYAKNLILGNGYSLDGIAVSIYREPGTSFYLVPFYTMFGIETPFAIFAAQVTQALLLGLLGFIIYRMVRWYSEWWLALLAGIAVCGLPIYGYYTVEIGAEMLFTFFIGVIFFICARIMRDPEHAPWYWFFALGLASGYQSLVRFQFVLFLPFIIFCYVCYFLYIRTLPPHTIRNVVIALVIFAAIPLSFASYIYANTGVFAVTDGRQNEMLYYRAVRAELSYGEITQYLRDWLWRSVSGGVNTPFLVKNEFKALGAEYEKMATTPEAVARIRAENIATILSRPGHYLYGNVVEVIKLAYLEHDYSESWSRYFWPSLYVIMYSLFLFGMYQFFRTTGNWDVRALVVLALLFSFYNVFTLSFLSTVPRFNTPYLFLYILIGFVGVVLFRRKRGLL